MRLGQHILSLRNPNGAWPTALNPSLLRIPSFHWHQIETSPGVFDWTLVDRICGRIPAGKDIILASSGTPRFYSARPDEPGNKDFPTGTLAEPSDFSKFENYLRRLLARVNEKCQPKTICVEGPNEPGKQSGYCSSDIAALIEWQRSVYKVSFAFPNVKVISAPVVMIDSGFDVLRYGFLNTQALHYLGVHDYSNDPVQLDWKLGYLKHLIKTYGGGNLDKPLMVTEWGLPVSDNTGARIESLLEQIKVFQKHNVYAVVGFAYDDPAYNIQGNPALEEVWHYMERA